MTMCISGHRLHDWRLHERTPIGLIRHTATNPPWPHIRNTWYCTRCRKFDIITEPLTTSDTADYHATTTAEADLAKD